MFGKNFSLGLIFSVVSLPVFSEGLTAQQTKELTVFSGKAMGTDVKVADIGKVLPRSDLNKLVSAGINLNGFLCASITDIRVLKVKATYEVTCIAYRNGTSKKTYMVDALKGVAFEP